MKTEQQIDIDQLWGKFYEIRDDFFRNLLTEHYRHLVKYAAKKLRSKLPDRVELDELISAGNFGLMEAIRSFDPDKGVKFETYCSSRIKGSILDDLRNKDWLPRLVRFRAKQLMKTRQLLEARLGRIPTRKETSAELDMDMEEFKRLERDAKVINLLSLDAAYANVEDEKDIREIDVVKDKKSEDPLMEAQRRDFKSMVTKSLRPSEKLILTLYYYEAMTMKDIGITVGLSESRVSQMHSSILKQLKAKLKDPKKKKTLSTPENITG